MASRKGGSLHAVKIILSRDFILGFLALFAFVLAHYMLTPTLPIYLERLGSRETEIGILVGAFGASSLVLRLFVGRALLTYSERRVMMAGAGVFTITFFGFVVLPLFWPLFVVRLFQGLAFACLDTAVLAFIVRIVPPTYTAQGIGYCLLAVNFSLALAPILGMFVINRFNFTLLFLVGAGLSLCAFFFSSLLKGPQNAGPKGTTAENGLGINRKVIPAAISCFFQNFIWGSLLAFTPLYAVKRGVNNPALFFSAIAVMTIASRILGGRILDTHERGKIAMVFMATSAVACATLAFAKTLTIFVAVGALWGIGAAFIFPALMAIAMDRAGSSRGTAVGTFRSLGDSGLALGPVLMGIVIPLTSYPTMFLCLGLTSFINLNYFYFCVRKGNRT